MKPILFSLCESSEIIDHLVSGLDIEMGVMTLHRFPDKECYIKIDSDVRDREIIVVTSLNNPDEKILPLLFFSRTAKELGVKSIGLVAPYLCYLRQDTRFSSGEGITSHYFADLLSPSFDWLMTVDPHLHRYKTLSEIYSIPTFVLHATESISDWIKSHVNNPVLIGPDIESKQWIVDIAEKIQAPYWVLEKIRHGDKNVEISIPDISHIKTHTLVLVDDIISTATTLVNVVIQLKNLGVEKIICIGVHAIFAEEAYRLLLETGITRVVTCNTIAHETNEINVSSLVIDGLVKNKLCKLR